jgi:hypothetical protein
MVGPGTTPEAGVTIYAKDATQGPACAICCPAATVFRNYFVDGCGQGGGRQLDGLSGVGEVVRNKESRYWDMKNGYCMPVDNQSIKKLSGLLTEEPDLLQRVKAALAVGIHWDTAPVSHGVPMGHRVAQVFSSALPLSYTKKLARESDWKPFAQAVLDATYAATFAAAAMLARQRSERVTVFLTTVGGGAFGNRSLWIAGAIAGALQEFEAAPLDVKFVHFNSIPRGPYAELAKKWKKSGKSGKSGKTQRVAPRAEVDVSKPVVVGSRPFTEGVKEVCTEFFVVCDLNKNSYLDRNEHQKFEKSLYGFFLPDVRARWQWSELDMDSDGNVDLNEWLATTEAIVDFVGEDEFLKALLNWSRAFKAESLETMITSEMAKKKALEKPVD